MKTHFPLNRLFSKFLFFYLIGILMLTGCTSIRSTVVDRDASGNFSGNCLSLHAKGIPVKLKVPTHLEVKIEETYFVDESNGNVLATDKRILNVTTETIYSDQLFTIHVVRPFAGTLDLTGTGKGYALTEDGYLQSLGGSITDKTINDVTEVIGGKGFKDLVKRTSATMGGKGLATQTRTIAVRRFDITECNWHLAMSDWVGQYIHQCTEDCAVEFIPDCSQTGDAMLPNTNVATGNYTE